MWDKKKKKEEVKEPVVLNRKEKIAKRLSTIFGNDFEIIFNTFEQVLDEETFYKKSTFTDNSKELRKKLGKDFDFFVDLIAGYQKTRDLMDKDTNYDDTTGINAVKAALVINRADYSFEFMSQQLKIYKEANDITRNILGVKTGAKITAPAKDKLAVQWKIRGAIKDNIKKTISLLKLKDEDTKVDTMLY